MHHLYLTAAAAALLAAAPFAAMAADAGPFDGPSPLPLHAPAFDKIKDADFQPALEAGMAAQRGEIDKIANNPAPATFENTIVAMERSGRMLDRVTSVFFALTSANTNEALEKVEADEAPKLSAFQDSVYLNPRLFARVKAIWEKRDSLGLDPESRQLVQVTYEAFVHAGANLADADKARLSEINARLATLSTTFQQRLLAADKAGGLVIDDKAQLAGLDDGEIAAAASAAKARGLNGKWVLPLQNTTQQPALQSLADRKTRQTLFERGSGPNRVTPTTPAPPCSRSSSFERRRRR